MNNFKVFLSLGVALFSGLASAGPLEDLLPGSYISITKPIPVRLEMHGRISGAHASFKDGIRVGNLDHATYAEKEGETICKVLTHFDLTSLKVGNYYNLFNAKSFSLLGANHKPVSNEDYLHFKCYRSRKTVRNPGDFLYDEIEYDLATLKKAFGNNLTFNLAKTEKFKINNVEFESGRKHGEDSLWRESCGYALYKFENDYYINMRSRSFGCNIKLANGKVEAGNLIFTGKKLEVKIHPAVPDTVCSAQFEISGSRPSKTVSFIEYSSVTNKPFYDVECLIK